MEEKVNEIEKRGKELKKYCDKNNIKMSACFIIADKAQLQAANVLLGSDNSIIFAIAQQIVGLEDASGIKTKRIIEEIKKLIKMTKSSRFEIVNKMGD